ESGAEADDPLCERECAEEDHERVQADARPDDDDDAERDRESSAQSDSPTKLRELPLCCLNDGAHWTTSEREIDLPSVAPHLIRRIGECADPMRDLRNLSRRRGCDP